MLKLKYIVRSIRSILTFWVRPYDINHLHNIRLFEFNFILNYLPSPPSKILEIGAGTGWQSKLLNEYKYDVCSIDLPTSNYASQRVWDVVNYDGMEIPFLDGEFNVIFSSNVMEHVPNLLELHREMYRVLDKDGICLHVMPTPTWRMFTNFTHILKFWNTPTVHGVHSDNLRDEYKFFGKENWKSIFNETNFILTEVYNIPLFYSGTAVFSKGMNLKFRSLLSYIFGGSCNVYILKKQNLSC
jgi:SAM-dependent methyltransferase